MKHQAMMEFILVGFLVAKAVAPLSPRAFVLAAADDAPHIGEGALPRFEKDLAWPQVPAKWKMGFGSAVGDRLGRQCVDSESSSYPCASAFDGARPDIHSGSSSYGIRSGG